MSSAISPAAWVAAHLPASRSPRDAAEAYAPANIALCKYWGKREESFKLPLTGSLSISMGALGTRMRIAPAAADSLRINGADLSPRDKAFQRLFAFLDLLRPAGQAFCVDSTNTLPMAAGLASSASAFAAAVLAVEKLYGWVLDGPTRSRLARLGSGSACRSVYEGFVEWHAGIEPDGGDSFAEPVAPAWPELRVGVLTVSAAPKAVGSSEGMKRTADTSRLYRAWPEQVARDLPKIRRAVLEHDFDTLGATAEQNALAMHATMIAAWPPVLYWQPETVAALHQVHALRAGGISVYATLDAGPNVKLLHPAGDTPALLETFPAMRVIDPSAAL